VGLYRVTGRVVTGTALTVEPGLKRFGFAGQMHCIYAANNRTIMRTRNTKKVTARQRVEVPSLNVKRRGPATFGTPKEGFATSEWAGSGTRVVKVCGVLLSLD
jgi:hypothetical protein